MQESTNETRTLHSGPGRGLLLENALFADVHHGRYYPRGTRILLMGDRIRRILEPGETGGVDFARRLDLCGRSVIPGLFNTHCHIQMTLPAVLAGPGDMLLNKLHWHEQIKKNMKDCLLHGITHVRDAWTDSLSGNRALKKLMDQGLLAGPRLYQSILVGPENGSFTTRRSPFVRAAFHMRNMTCVDFDEKDSGVVTFPSHGGIHEIRRAVDRAIDERGASFIKLYEQKQDWFTGNFNTQVLSPEQWYTLVDYAHMRGVRTTLHQVRAETMRRALAAGVTSIAHLPNDRLLTDEDIKAFLDAKAILEPTASVLYHLCWKIRDDELEHHPSMERLTRYREETYREVSRDFWLEAFHERFLKGFERSGRNRFRMLGLDASPLFRVYARSVVNGLANMAKLFEAGAMMGCGNDAGAVCSTPAMVQHELALISLGLGMGSNPLALDGAEALRIATLNSARAMGIDADYGSLEEGKVADLAVLEEDPFQEPDRIGSKVTALFMDGRLVVDRFPGGLSIDR